jgi:hypothetical protein
MKNRLRVFENRVLRRTFVPKREEVTGGWRTLPDEGLHNVYTQPNIIRVIKLKRIKCERQVVRMGKMINEYKTLVGKREGKRPLGRTKLIWRIILE